jgi:hypothetical protein
MVHDHAGNPLAKQQPGFPTALRDIFAHEQPSIQDNCSRFNKNILFYFCLLVFARASYIER